MIAPRTRRPANNDRQAGKFIAGTTGPAPARDLVPKMINFDRELAERITAGARKMGLNFSAFVVSAAFEKLTKIEQEEGGRK